MAPPFEVPVASNAVCKWLWALRQAPGARNLYRQDLLKQEIVSFLAPMRFFELHEAVDAALSSEGCGEVKLVRNVTLPAPLNHKELCNRHGATLVWAMINEGQTLTLRSTGGPWRIRHHVPGGNGAVGCALFSLDNRAKLKVHGVDFEIVCVPTGNPLRPRLAVMPRHDNVASESDDFSEDNLEEMHPAMPAMTPFRQNDIRVWRSNSPTGGASLELSKYSAARGYDSYLVAKASWAFAGSSARASGCMRGSVLGSLFHGYDAGSLES